MSVLGKHVGEMSGAEMTINIKTKGETMPISGEAIRMMNYADDIATTLRRILMLAPSLTAEERKRVQDHMQGVTPTFAHVLEVLGASK